MLLFCPILSIAQDPVNVTINVAAHFDAPASIIPAPGGYALFGRASASQGAKNDAFFLKVNSLGVQQKLVLLGTPGGDESFGRGAVAVGNEFVVAGRKNGEGWLVRLDAQGTLLKETTVVGTGPFQDMVALPDGGFIAVGSTSSKVTAVRFKSDFSVVWNRQYNLSGNQASICLSASGGYFFVATGNKIMRVRVSSGSSNWVRNVAIPDIGPKNAYLTGYITDIIATSNNRLMVSMSVSGTLGTDTWSGFGASAWTELGQFLWDRAYNVTYADIFSTDYADCNSLSYITNAQNIMLAGTVKGSFVVTRIDLNGNFVEATTIGPLAEYFNPYFFKHSNHYVGGAGKLDGNVNTFFYHSPINDLQPLIAAPQTTTLANDVRIYPNPARDQFTLELNLENDQQVRLELIDVAGKLVRTLETQGFKGLNRIEFDLSGLPTGQYWMHNPYFNRPQPIVKSE